MKFVLGRDIDRSLSNLVEDHEISTTTFVTTLVFSILLMCPGRVSFHNWDSFIGQERDTIVLNNVNDNVDDDNDDDELAYCNLLIASNLLVIAATPDEYR